MDRSTRSEFGDQTGGRVSHSINQRAAIRSADAGWRLRILPPLIAALAGGWLLVAPTRADEQQIQLDASRRSAAIRLIGGKSETVRTEKSFSEVIVSDPEIADVVPLTD